MLIELCKTISGEIFNELGSGFDECIYQKAFEVSLRLANIKYENQRVIPVFYRGFNIGDSKLDLVVYNDSEVLIIELKAIASLLSPKEETQLKKYMELLKIPQGILVNFPQPGRKGGVDSPEFVELPKSEVNNGVSCETTELVS
jgi:GxxExxY protein